MAKKVLYAVGLLIKTVLLCCTAAQQWEATGQPEVSKFGMMLQRHIFKRITGAGLSDVCLRGCYADVRCQSFNYVFTQDICELSNRTKEARPEDYVPNPERFYFKRDYKRGFYFFFLLSSSLQRHFHSTETQPEIKELSHITSILALSQVALKLTVLAPKTNIKSCLLGVLC